MCDTYSRRREDSEISGGRFVQPAADTILPPVRTSQIQGGRFVQPAANNILPPVRNSQIQVDWDNAYHFGSSVTDQVRGLSRKG